MREVEIKLTGTQNLGETVIKIDDKPVRFKKNEFGSYVCKYQTENDKVNIKVLKMLDVGGVWWFITQLFFFIISIFGIFDIHHKERCLIVDFEADFDLNEENKITLQVQSPKEDTKAIAVETNLSTQEISNTYYLDEKAKKTFKILNIAKIILALAIVATIIIVVLTTL